MLCPDCGREAGQGQYCRVCGAALPVAGASVLHASTAPDHARARRKKRQITLITVLAGILMLAALALIAATVILPQHESEKGSAMAADPFCLSISLCSPSGAS